METNGFGKLLALQTANKKKAKVESKNYLTECLPRN